MFKGKKKRNKEKKKRDWDGVSRVWSQNHVRSLGGLRSPPQSSPAGIAVTMALSAEEALRFVFTAVRSH